MNGADVLVELFSPLHLCVRAGYYRVGNLAKHFRLKPAVHIYRVVEVKYGPAAKECQVAYHNTEEVLAIDRTLQKYNIAFFYAQERAHELHNHGCFFWPGSDRKPKRSRQVDAHGIAFFF